MVRERQRGTVGCVPPVQRDPHNSSKALKTAVAITHPAYRSGDVLMQFLSCVQLCAY